MVLESREAPPFYKNGYVLGCDRTREGIVIDPGDEVEMLLRIVDEQQIRVRYILLTHGHVDHVSGVGRARSVLGAPVILHADDRPLYEAAHHQGAFFGLSIDPLPPIDACYEPGQVLSFGGYEARVLHTPGHTPGGVCLLVGPTGQPGLRVFVGDTLFAGSIGRTDLPGGRYDTLIASIRGVLFGLEDAVEVHSGHGPQTTIGRERRSNPFLVGSRERA